MKERHGFTLIELISVMAILTVLAGISLVGYSKYIETARINSAAREIKGNIELAKLQAIRRRVPVAIVFTDGTGASGRYIIFEDNGASPKLIDAGEEIIITQAMPDKVELTANSFPSAGIRFNAIGLPITSTGSIQVRNSIPDKYRRISLGPAGTITFEYSTDGSNWRE